MERARLNSDKKDLRAASRRRGSIDSPKKISLLVSAVLLLQSVPLIAQEALKMSLASAEAAEARRKAASTVGYYNLQLGQSYWSFTGNLGAEYNSNVNLTQNGAEDDYIFRPELDVKLLVPVSDKNSLNVAIGAGYSFYVMHSDLRRYFITPGTEVSFDVYAGDVLINLHDRISVSENSSQDPTVAGNGLYSQLQNAAGIDVTWDLNKLVLRAGYDHANYSTLSGGTGQPDSTAEQFFGSAGLRIGSGLQVGTELGGAILDYDSSSTSSSSPNSTEWNAGLFCEARASEYTQLRVNVGYTQYLPDLKTSTVGGQNFSGVYVSLALNHRLNQFVSYSLSVGRNVSFALSGGTLDLYSFNWSANWKIFQKTSLSTSFDFEHGSQLSSGAETFDRYGPAINLGRNITEKMNGSIGFQYYWRGSNLAGRDYTAFTITSNLSYRF